MKKITLIIFVNLLLFSSCNDVLDKQPLDIISDASLWSEKILIDDYLNECYAEMKFYFEMQYDKDYSWFESTYATTIADEATGFWGGTTPKSHWININGGVYEWWGYPTIRKLNTFLEKMESSSLDDSYKKQRIAEARFLRAFAYFDMVKRYGGVPLITRAQQLNDTNEELYRKRDKEADIYDFILSELDAVVNDLPTANVSSDLGRPTKYAVLALKSRAAMYGASIATWGTVQLDGIVGLPKEKAPSYWQASYDASKSIIESGIFTLYNKYPTDKVKNFRNLFLDENNNSEVIFSERFNGLSGKGHSWDMFEDPLKYNPWGGGQRSLIYLEMVESFDNTDGTSGVIDRSKITSGYSWTMDELFGKKDPRFKASIYTQGSSWTYTNGPVTLDYHYSIEHDGVVQTSGSYKGVLAKSSSYTTMPFGILKYLDESKAVTVERFYSETDYIIFRLGEIYLNYAESAIELGKPNDALLAVNNIRERAGMPLYTSITRDLVRKERKVELAFEGNRYFDVRRWRTAVTDLTNAFHGLQFILKGDSYQQGSYNVSTAKYKLNILNNVDGTPSPFFVEKFYYLPISLTRTGNNANLVENPGYQ